MIFARRAVQRRLNELRPVLGDAAVDGLVVRLNRPGRDRLAAMWEVVVLHALAPLGSLASEVALASGRRPDVAFAGHGIAFTADITTPSDEGIDERNPVEALADEIEKLKSRLKLPMGGVDLRVHERSEKSNRGSRRVLQLPPKKTMATFVCKCIEPALRKQIYDGNDVLRLKYRQGDVAFDLVIDPKKSPYSTRSHGAYDIPTITDGNPLYDRLKQKARQLKGAQGLVGVIVGDGDTQALADRRPNWSTVATKAIIEEFARQYRSVGFVLLLSARQKQAGGSFWVPREIFPHGELWVRPGLESAGSLDDLFRRVVEALPQPIATPANAARRAREPGYHLGHHGGGEMSARRIKISAREVMEVLAGRRTVAELNASRKWYSSTETTRAGDQQNIFDRWLAEGRLPRSISVTTTGEDEADEWIEIEVGDPDPAISPFR